MMTSSIETATLIAEILKDYELPIRGQHGIGHWARVLENGLKLADATGGGSTGRDVVLPLSRFATCERLLRPRAQPSGRRIRPYMRGTLLHLNDADFEQIFEACRLHTNGLMTGDITLQVCWDADRLDLGRVGITPDPKRLCTDAARRLLRGPNDGPFRITNLRSSWSNGILRSHGFTSRPGIGAPANSTETTFHRPSSLAASAASTEPPTIASAEAHTSRSSVSSRAPGHVGFFANHTHRSPPS